MTRYDNDAEGGSNGVTATTSDTGSGDSFSAISSASGAVVSYTSTTPIKGALSYLMTQPNTGNTCFVALQDVSTSADFSFRFYISFPTLPSATHQLVGIRSVTPGAGIASVEISSTGQVRAISGASIPAFAGSTMATGTVYRIEGQGAGFGTASATLNVQVYVGDATGTPYISATATASSANQCQLLRYGKPGTSSLFTGYELDDFAQNIGSSTAIGPSAAPAFNGTLDTSGAGTLVLAATLGMTGSLALSGVGALSLSGVMAAAGGAALSGAGTLTLAGTPAHTGTRTFSGTGTLTLAGTPGAGGTLVLSGAGTLVLTGSPGAAGALTLSGTGTLTLASTGSGSGVLTTSGVGTLTLAGTPGVGGTLPLGGTGTLSLAGTPALAGAAALSGTGTLSLLGGGAAQGTLGLSGSGQLVLAGTPAHRGALGLSGIGALGLLGTPLSAGGTLALSGAGTLTTDTVLALSGLLQLGSIGYLAEAPGGRQVGLTPSNEMVAVAWLKATVPYLGNRVATMLPTDNSTWAASGFTTVATIGGTPNIEVPVSEPVFAVDSWGVALNSGRLPWNLASQPAEAIKAACVEHGEIPKILVMPVGYNYARVLSVVPLTEPRRVGGDTASYAHYTQDVEFRWVKT